MCVFAEVFTEEKSIKNMFFWTNSKYIKIHFIMLQISESHPLSNVTDKCFILSKRSVKLHKLSYKAVELDPFKKNSRDNVCMVMFKK